MIFYFRGIFEGNLGRLLQVTTELKKLNGIPSTLKVWVTVVGYSTGQQTLKRNSRSSNLLREHLEVKLVL